MSADPSDDRFRSIVEAIPSAIVLVGRDRRIRLVNRKAEALFGYARDELLDAPVELLIPERFRAGHATQVASFFAAPETRAMGAGRDLFGRRKSGEEVPIEIGLSPIDTAEGLCTLASIIDITERRRAQERFELVVEASPSAMIMIDASRRIRLANRRAEELFGYAREEFLGQPIEMLVPERYRPGHPAHVAQFSSRPEARPMGAGRDLFGLRKDGTEVPVEIGLTPIDAPDGHFVVASIIDITERRRSEDELRRSNAELEQFAYVASHDLQEPLRMVANYTELLAQRYGGQLDERADKYIRYASDGARRMQRLVADLLAYSRVGSQGKALAPVAAGEVMAAVTHGLQRLLREAGGAVETGPLPRVMADEGQLHQLLQNLVSNAIKFRAEAPPRVRVEARPDGLRWIFSVSDNGIGIDMQYAQRIFQMFQRLHEQGRYEGSGIGLAIAKRIVERHGGTIWIDSAPGRGSTVSFSLPAARTEGSA
ncbi:PAS domain S-box protein [Mitsuaria sp. GD03876]|uniref:sensor histidine kinase n=1 Tax=Mitsuaria sp. GD03876 TaxID=2975399 RepID=UPI0024475959|nr:PAS domain S-box protein [Mitsuaria sp. GD03876]MDH0865026.1 PAS domain S-box protein [Mitsuaria sp. GD03876]